MCDFELVDPAFVSRCLADRDRGEAVCLLEAHFTSHDHPAPDDGTDPLHLPGAIEVHPSYLESGTDCSRYYPHYSCPEDGNLLPDELLVDALERLGISPSSLVIVYGKEPDGSMAAARLCWALLYAGVHRVRLLDGGLDAWLAAGGSTVIRCPTAAELGRSGERLVHAGPGGWQGRVPHLASTELVREAALGNGADEGLTLVDVRKRGEWDGTFTHYYPFFSKAGHIPRAKLQGDWDTLLDMKSHKLAPTLGTVKERWQRLGIISGDDRDRERTLIFYCGTGWRSSISFLVAHLLGLRARNYDSGFYGWSWNDENPVEAGFRPPFLFPEPAAGPSGEP